MKKLVTKTVEKLESSKLVEFVNALLNANYEKECDDAPEEFEQCGPAYYKSNGVWYRVIGVKEKQCKEDITLAFLFELEIVPSLIETELYATREYVEDFSKRLTAWIAGTPLTAIIHYELVEDE